MNDIKMLHVQGAGYLCCSREKQNVMKNIIDAITLIIRGCCTMVLKKLHTERAKKTKLAVRP
jgi:hypothetical protein